MRNRTPIQVNVGGHQSHEHHHTTHEHKAPTDASIQLLNEFKEKTVSGIMSSIPIELNGLKMHLIRRHDITMIHGAICVILDINGRRFEKDIEIEPTQWSEMTQSFARQFSDFVATSILMADDNYKMVDELLFRELNPAFK